MARNNKQTRLGSLIIIIVIIIIVAVFVSKMIKSNNKEEQNSVTNQIQTQTEENQEKYVKTLEDGTKLNTSTKLKENKKLDNLEIKDIQLTYKNGVTNLLATVSNTENKKIEMTRVEIELIDENKKTIYKLQGIVEETEAGKQAELNCSITADFANAYDFNITKK